MKNPIATTTTTDRSTFTFAATGNTIRVIERDGEPWFVAADVLTVFGVPKEARSMWLSRLDADQKGQRKIATPGGVQPCSIVSESGLYLIIMRAHRKNPVARQFQDWVTREVLPAIRKDGAYVMGEEKVATGEMSEDEMTLPALTRVQAKVERITAIIRPTSALPT